MADNIKEKQHQTLSRPTIELRSTEVQEVMGRMPSAIVRMGQGIILLIFVSLLSYCLFLTYPNYTVIDSHMSNVNNLRYVYAKYMGQVARVHKKNGSFIHPGDTLCLIKTEQGNQYVIAKNKGYLYICNEMQEGQYIKPETVLSVIADTLYTSPFTTLYVSEEEVIHLKSGLSIVGKCENKPIRGEITKISTLPNPQTGVFLVNIQWEKLNFHFTYPFYRRKITVELRSSDIKIWKVLFQQRNIHF